MAVDGETARPWWKLAMDCDPPAIAAAQLTKAGLRRWLAEAGRAVPDAAWTNPPERAAVTRD